MKHYKKILVLLLITLVSCSSDDSASTAAFAITQDTQQITELDRVNFETTGNRNISSVAWYVNNELVPSSTDMSYFFSDSGNYTVKAVIEYLDSDNATAQITLEQNFTVTARAKHLVTIKKIEIENYAAAGLFLYGDFTHYMRAYTQISELYDGQETIKYISDINSQNWGVNTMIYPMSWDISSQNYIVKVYDQGNYYPNEQETYNTDIKFFMAKKINDNGDMSSYSVYNDLKLDLNPYRSLQPATIDVNNGDTTVRVTLEWN